MARAAAGLVPVENSITLWQRLVGGYLGARYSKLPDPPLSGDKTGFYLAALGAGDKSDTGEDENRAALLRCLVWTDAKTKQFRPKYLHWYREAVSRNPTDERCLFFVAALARHEILEDKEAAIRAFAAILKPEWAASPYWGRFDIAQKDLARDLARLYAAPDGPAYSRLPASEQAERLAFVEETYSQTAERSPERAVLRAFLCRVYREANRADDDALAIYEATFADTPDDDANAVFFAEICAYGERCDSLACAVYARMTNFAEEEGRDKDAGVWAVRLARAYLALGRFDEGTLSIYRQAVSLAPGDDVLEAAFLHALARRRGAEDDLETLARMESAFANQDRYLPLFKERHWDWGLIVRALALSYGMIGRIDDDALAVYARATELCGEDRVLWTLRARAIAETENYSLESLAVYERATVTDSDDPVIFALARTYIETGLGGPGGARRSEAIPLWESLYRQGLAWPELETALALAYTGDDRVNDIALSLWEKEVAESRDSGLLQLRLGREWRLRGDADVALKWHRGAARLLPRDFDAQYELGALLKDNYSDNAGAIKHLQKAVKLPPGALHLGAHFALGEALVALEKRDEAKKVFERIAEVIEPNHSPTLFHLAKLNLKYEAHGVRQAEALYEQALSLNPENPETYRRMAELYREKGETQSEEEALEKYLSLAAPDADKFRQLADLYMRRGDFARAEGALRRIVAMGQGDKKLYTLLGEVILQAQTLSRAA